MKEHVHDYIDPAEEGHRASPWAIDAGLVVEVPHEHPDGCVTPEIKITKKGLEFMYRKLGGKMDIDDLISGKVPPDTGE